MNMLNLTEEDITQLRSSIPESFKACPHWDNRIRFFTKDGRPAVLFCCNRPDFNGYSEPIGEGLQRSQTCVVSWGSAKIPPETLAREMPTLGYIFLDEWPNPIGHPVTSLYPVGRDDIDDFWERALAWIDAGAVGIRLRNF